LVIAKDGSAVDRHHFPASHHAAKLGGGANRQRAHVLLLDRKRERPFLSERRELLPGFLGAAISASVAAKTVVTEKGGSIKDA
jgi:hypothetical protein